MNTTARQTGDIDIPRRGMFSILVLLALVLAVTAQLVTGFWLAAHPARVLLAVHIGVGFVAILFTAAEWAWLLATRVGRAKLIGFFGRGTGLAQWSEGFFLIAVTLTVIAGALLAATMRLGANLPYALLLGSHRALAIAVAVLYLVHSGFAMRRGKRRSRDKMV